MSKVYLSIGSNKGNRSALIKKAIDKIEKKIGIIISRSSTVSYTHLRAHET